MPGGDGKGPLSQGPLTGRGMGTCGSGGQSDTPDTQNENLGGRLLSGISRMLGRGQKKGRGTGQGFGGGRGRNRA
ncbi:DUF5320 domain-containing protein [bacterium]|nr:DUF5320 domain-containing protein [bacterium]